MESVFKPFLDRLHIMFSRSTDPDEEHFATPADRGVEETIVAANETAASSEEKGGR
uniref:Uncharacterized protein n=1 Tax=Oryza barthii TaxID=65489 RepID=A0A0D3H4L5_9ORYZ